MGQHFFHPLLCLSLLIIALIQPTARAQEMLDLDLNTKPAQKIHGSLVSWNDQQIVLKTDTQERTINWFDMTPASAFRVRQRLTDRNKPDQLLELGEMGRAMGIDRPAAQVIDSAVKRDPTLRLRAEFIMQKKLGYRVATKQKSAAATSPSPPSLPEYSGVRIYHETTSLQDMAAIEQARSDKQEVESALGIKLAELQTPHFIVFTDWDPSEYNFLRENLEGAYTAVARVFRQDPRQNIFTGKLPIYMLAHREDFQRFADVIDHATQPGVQQAAGYFTSSGHIVMWKPDTSNPRGIPQDAQVQWAYVLSHEFTHAFTHYYLTSRLVPRWVSEGLAETVATGLFPMVQGKTRALDMMLATSSLADFWANDDVQQQFEFYSIHRTLIQTLLAKDPAAFTRWFDALKAGDDPEAALQTYFQWNYADLERYWRIYVLATSGRQ